MEDFCGSKLWDSDLTWNTDKPDFTPCFEKTVLVWIPAGFILLFGTIDIWSVRKSKNAPIPNTAFVLIQYACIILLMAVEVADFVYTFKSGREIFPVDRVAPVIKFLSYLLAAVLLFFNRRNGVPSSGVIFFFWFFSTLCGVFEFQSLIRSSTLENGDAHAKFWYVTTMISYPVVVLEFLLNFFSDAKNLPKSQLQSQNETQTRAYKKLPKLEPCPAPLASFPSRLTFQWFWKVAWLGYKKPLEYDELWDLPKEEKSLNVMKDFYKYWKPALADAQRWNAEHPEPKEKTTKQSEKKDKKSDKKEKTPKSTRRTASVLPAMWSAVWSHFLFGASLKLVQDLLNFVAPQLLDRLIEHGNSNDVEWKGYFYAVLLFVTVMVQTLFLSQYFYLMFIIGMRVRSSLIGAIYEKSLIISNAARKAFTVGEIVNLMSVDAQRFVDLTAYINMVWSAPLQISLSLYFLYQTLGPSIFAGVAVLILLIPVSGFMASKMKVLQMQQLKNKDQRVKLMNEILSGIKVLKLYAWEPSFQDQVEAIRRKELALLRKASIWQAASMFVYYTTPFLVSLVTFGTYVLIDKDNVLDSQKAFVSLTLFNIMRMPMTMLPLIIVYITEANVSLTRINKFMNAEEIDKNAVSQVQNGDSMISIKNGSFTWDESDTLKNINLEVKKGSLVAVVGTVGSGKSSLLSAILGEMEKTNGSVNRVGSVAYVAQQAWIQNATLKENILFEKDMDESLYKRVISACALEPDLKILPAGDKTEIGEKGINLSGGQKQRVSLARAVYNNADLYLLDDPLSAVDSHVGKHLFEKVIGPRGVLKHKTRVIVTHAITYLPHVDHIIVMVDGRISETGSFNELLEKKGSFSDFLEQHAATEDLENVDEETAKKLQGVIARREYIASNASASLPQARKASMWSLKSQGSERRKGSKAEDAVTEKGEETTGDKLIEIEKAETGSVKRDVYWHYMRSLGKGFVFASFLFTTLTQVFSVYSNVWLSKWSEEGETANGASDPGKRDMFLGVYGALGVGQALSILLGSLAMSLGCIKAAGFLHSHMLQRVLRSPMSFFDTTPLGRIVNRFSKDVDVADSMFPMNLRSWLQCFFQVTATLVVISYSTPLFMVVILPIGIVYFMTQRFYVATSRQLKRIESVTRSPIYSHFSETLTGTTTIRAFGMGPTFMIDSATKVDVNQIAYFPSIIANRWLAVRLETVGNLIILFAALFAVLSDSNQGSLGLSVSYALNITQTLNWLVRMTSDVETNVVAIERIKEYGEVEQEAEWEIVSAKPSKDWPSEGKIEFDHYQTRYREGLDLVLRDVTCKINSGEKIGIVGRTGAGKSSLTVGLFRIIEAAGGRVVIDGIDISKIGLHDVRGKLTIIPQDPVLFSGTLRINLDPFEQKSDSDLWSALEYAHLKDFVKSLPEGLEYKITEGGDNLSVGQRQLVCLARALLRKTKVLILDEATAAVDLDTDDLIQNTIRSEFKDCTVLTIAHRLNTIMDYNRIMVLDKGEIREFDSPQNLLQNSNSIFYGMAKDAGLV